VAPYYGVDADGTRGGWNSEFVGRIQRAEYSQYVWDLLPIAGPEHGSILRLDHLFPIATDPANWIATDLALRVDALNVLDEWITWHFNGSILRGGLLELARTELGRLE
jgi:hypothetical protein